MAQSLEGRRLLSATLSTVVTFNGTNGSLPAAGLTYDAGALYGTSSNGGASGFGTLFKVADGANSIITVISFNGSNGEDPQSALADDGNGNLYSTTAMGGDLTLNSGTGGGTLFKLATATNSLTTIANFGPFYKGNSVTPSGDTAGGQPRAGVVIDRTGNLYGTTNGAYYDSDGTVFRIAAGTSKLVTIASLSPPGTSGSIPQGLIADASGNIYGTTLYGGDLSVTSSDAPDGGGTVFEIAPGTNKLTTLATFHGINGQYPQGLVIDKAGNLFGTTELGGRAVSGSTAVGTVFEIAVGSRTLTTLTTFSQSNGGLPQGNLILDAAGNLYGTTSEEGNSGKGYGTIFKLNPSSRALTTLATFNGANGKSPVGNLTVDPAGNLYGVTEAGGVQNLGTLFKVVGSGFVPGAGPDIIVVPPPPQTVLPGVSTAFNIGTSLEVGAKSPYSVKVSWGDGSPNSLFAVSAAGTIPVRSHTFTKVGTYIVGVRITDSKGNTSNVGTFAVTATPPKITLMPPVAQAAAVGKAVLFTLGSFSEVEAPGPYSVDVNWGDGSADTTFTQSSAGTLVSQDHTFTVAGNKVVSIKVKEGATSSVTTFVVTVILPAAASLTTVVTFNGVVDGGGQTSMAGLVADSAGNLYGTTSTDANIGDGTVFKIAAGTNKITTLVTFDGAVDDGGSSPLGGLAIDAAGNLYGTTSTDATYNGGTIFKIAAGTNKITTLAVFDGTADDGGMTPDSGLVLDHSGNLYGTTMTDVQYSGGTVFKIVLATGKLQTLALFDGIVAGGAITPKGKLVVDAAGDLYGAATGDLKNGDGAIFKIVAGTNKLTALAVFNGALDDGGTNPVAGLVMDTAGNLYGTTQTGGTKGDGTVFKIGAGTGALTTLVNFDNSSNGAFPSGDLIEDSAGNLYGTTTGDGRLTFGSVFKLSTVTNSLLPLTIFNSNSGNTPVDGLVADSVGNLYGTTSTDGIYDGGSVFKLSGSGYKI